MAETTGISWTDATFNHVIGCTKVAAGCANCYAEADMDKRRGRVKWGPNGTRSRTSDEYWKGPLKWNRAAQEAGVRKRVFCASLADIFEEWDGPIRDSKGVDLCVCHGCGSLMYFTQYCEKCTADRLPRKLTMSDLRRDLFRLIDATPWLDWQLLTKRPENIRKMWPTDSCDMSGRHRKNVWLGTSIATQADADRSVPELLKCRDLAPVLFVSAEPLIGPVDLTNIVLQKTITAKHTLGNRMELEAGDKLDSLGGEMATTNGACLSKNAPRLDWVIIGGESGPKARLCDIEWIRSLKDQCKAAGVSCFVKQLGSRVDIPPGDAIRMINSGANLDRRKDAKGGDPSEWPVDIRVQEFPK